MFETCIAENLGSKLYWISNSPNKYVSGKEKRRWMVIVVRRQRGHVAFIIGHDGKSGMLAKVLNVAPMGLIGGLES